MSLETLRPAPVPASDATTTAQRIRALTQICDRAAQGDLEAPVGSLPVRAVGELADERYSRSEPGAMRA